MYLIECANQNKVFVSIRKVQTEDFKTITIKRYFFKWKAYHNTCEIFKLTLLGKEDILGLIAIIDHPSEERLEIKLLAVSHENVGQKKRYDRIAGCLIAFACRNAIKRYNNFPCVSLTPKTELKKHYIHKYGMFDAGRQIYLEEEALINIINFYYND